MLPGHVLKNLARMSRLSAIAPDQQISLTIALQPTSSSLAQDAVARAALVRQGKASWLSPRDVGRLYGQPQSAIDALAAYFAGFGLTVSPPAPDHLSFKVSGTAAQVEQALGVTLDNYQDSKGHRFYATSKDPRLPANLAATVQGILGLDTYPALKRLSVKAAGSPGSYTPSDMQTAYNVIPLFNQGIDGSGKTIGILGCDRYNLSDVRAFESLYMLPATSVTNVDVDGGAAGNQIETTMDIEWSQTMAPNAAIRVYSFTSAGCNLIGLYDSLAAARGDSPSPDVISISLGACESDLSPSGIQLLETAFAASAAQGQSVLVASGDSGAYECGGGPPDPPSGVSFPGSSAYVTSVGGTALLINSDGSYGSESAWGSTTECAGPCGSGGGYSGIITRPSWQNNVNANSYRAIPDVSLNADPATGNNVYFQGTLQPGWGGTSIAAPQWAGILALMNQAAGHRFGLVNPLLYGSVASAPAGCTVYHDVTTGNNLYYNATPGYDLATGWGSPNAANLLPILKSSAASTAQAASTISGPYLVFLPIVFQNACAS